MNEYSFKLMLQSLCAESQLIKFESDFCEKFSALVYCILDGDSYDDRCAAFIEKFSKQTQTNWITSKRFGNQVRYLFRKVFVCQLSKKNKTNRKRKYLNKVRDTECTATVDFKWKQVNSRTCRNDPYLRTGLNCVINIKFIHTHVVNAADAMVHLRCNKDTTEQFHSYFRSGMSPSAAKSYHEIFLIEAAQDENSLFSNMANAQINPTIRQVTHLYNTWKKSNQQAAEASLLDTLRTKKQELEDNGYHLSVHEETSTVAIVTPIMKRVFVEFPLDHSGLIFIDSTDQYQNSKQTLNNAFLTFLFVGSKIGALPLGCVFHTPQNFQDAFSLIKKTLEESTDKKLCPSVIMTYESAAQRIALQMVFPTSTILLSASHVRHGAWRWMWMSKNNVKEQFKKPIMEYFQKVLLAPTIESATERHKEMVSKLKECPQAIKYFEHLWFRRSEWCLAFRSQILPANINIDDCEVSIRVLKDAFLQRCKNFNAYALIELVCFPFENYHKQRLADFASPEMDDKMLSHYSKFCKVPTNIDIVEVGVNEYQINSRVGGNHIYTVNTDWATCDCGYGKSGKYCEHLTAVEKKLNFWVNTRPVLSQEDKALFARLAFGLEIVVKIENTNDDASPYSEPTLEMMETDIKPTFDMIEIKPKPEMVETDIKHFSIPNLDFCSTSVSAKDCSTTNDIGDTSTCSIVPETDPFQDTTSSHRDVAANIRHELIRIADLLDSSSSTNFTRLNRFYKMLQRVKTPAHALRLAPKKQKLNRNKLLKQALEGARNTSAQK